MSEVKKKLRVVQQSAGEYNVVTPVGGVIIVDEDLAARMIESGHAIEASAEDFKKYNEQCAKDYGTKPEAATK